MLLRRLSQCCRFVLFSAALLLGVVACVPTEPAGGKGGKNCRDCHTEYRQMFSEGVVHKPVQSNNCFGCHRKHGLIGGAYLKAEEPKLCLVCHQALAQDLSGKNLHEPVGQGRCSDCHQPHNSQAQNLLTKTEPEICFECHEPEPFQRDFRHSPLQTGCRTCHQPHGSSQENLLNKPEVELCSDCHQIDKPDFVQKHGGYRVTTNCSSCHSVHSADNSSLLKRFVHAPIASLDCNGCHLQAGSETEFQLSASGSALCADCHDELEGIRGRTGTHSPVTDGECFACHDPHASNFSGVIKESANTLCFTCHSFDTFGPDAKIKGGFAHTPVKNGDCLSCHAPHRPARGQQKLLRKDADQLCLTCHPSKVEAKSVVHKPASEGQCTTCHLPHESLHSGVLTKQQRPLCGECHQQVGEDLGLPSLHRPFVSGRCSSCHEPHGSDRNKLLTSESSKSCSACHSPLEAERKLNNRHQPFKEGRCDLCHRPHGSREAFLLTAPAGELCASCHDDYVPVAGTPAGHQNCSVCHYGHGNDEKKYLLKAQPDLCLGCHDVDRYWADGVGHSPAKKGRCIVCHDPHKPQNSVVDRNVKALCAECHDTSEEILAKKHGDIMPGADSCLNCHDPHGGPDQSLTLPVKHEPFSEGDCASCHQGGKK